MKLRKNLVNGASLALVGLPILVLILVQQAGARRIARLLRKVTMSLRPFRDRVTSELAELDRQITWDEVLDWLIQMGARSR